MPSEELLAALHTCVCHTNKPGHMQCVHHYPEIDIKVMGKSVMIFLLTLWWMLAPRSSKHFKLFM